MGKNEHLRLRHIIIRVMKPFLAIISIAVIGTLGFHSIEGWNLLDSFYMSIISITTVGYETPEPLTKYGKFFTCIYLLFCVVIFLFLASEFARHVIGLNIKEYLDKRQMDARIKNIKDHYIICGFGRTGREVANNLVNEKLNFVVIDKDISAISNAQDLGYLVISGDATDENTIKEARIESCKGIFACLREDSDSLFLVITVKDLCPDLPISVRCLKLANADKFKKVGVNEVVSPFAISSLRMVSSMIRPLVADFLEEVMNTNVGLELRMEQFQMPGISPLCGKSLLESDIRRQSGAFILAIKREENFIHNPTAQEVLKPDDYLIVLGTTDQLLKLEEIIKSKGSRIR